MLHHLISFLLNAKFDKLIVRLHFFLYPPCLHNIYYQLHVGLNFICSRKYSKRVLIKPHIAFSGKTSPKGLKVLTKCFNNLPKVINYISFESDLTKLIYLLMYL